MDSSTGIIAAFQRAMACCSGKRKQKRVLRIVGNHNLADGVAANLRIALELPHRCSPRGYMHARSLGRLVRHPLRSLRPDPSALQSFKTQ